LAFLCERELRRPGDPRPHPQDDLEILRAKRNEARVLGPRPDEAHFALEDVPELWDFVDLRAGQKTPNPGKPPAPVDGESGPVRVLVHLSELEHLQLAPMEPDTATAIEDRPGAVELDPNG